jgi:hypothetical protein
MRCAPDSVSFSDSNLAGGMLLVLGAEISGPSLERDLGSDGGSVVTVTLTQSLSKITLPKDFCLKKIPVSSGRKFEQVLKGQTS